jgi:catechol 2,3-dioxygenase
MTQAETNDTMSTEEPIASASRPRPSSSTAPAWLTNSVPTAGAAPDATRMDTVQLLVRDLDAMTRFYHEAVTLDVLAHDGVTAALGRGGVPIVRLRRESDLPARNARGAGLYHTAIVFQDERHLATSLASMAQRAGHLYEGSADHLVSEAFYFHDPEGNGLELYRDRPREQWPTDSLGRVTMGLEPLDPGAFLRTWYDARAAADTDTASAAVGHVHLQVGDIPRARAFYVDALGFDVIADMGSALFVSAGGYHHHLAMNTWQSAGAGPRAASFGLGDVRIRMPSQDDVAATADRLAHRGIAVRDDGASLRVADPWGTQLVISPDDEAAAIA